MRVDGTYALRVQVRGDLADKGCIAPQAPPEAEESGISHVGSQSVHVDETHTTP